MSRKAVWFIGDIDEEENLVAPEVLPEVTIHSGEKKVVLYDSNDRPLTRRGIGFVTRGE
jgi:hypothetical protein